MVQKTNYSLSVRQDVNVWFVKIYPIVDIRSGINDLGPEEAFTKGVAHWLALPTYVVNFQ